MEIKSEGQKEKQKIVLMAVLLAGSCFLTYYFHQVLQTGTVFTHFFYIPIILASMWWKRKGVAVALFLALFLVLSHHILREYVLAANDYLRACMFVLISVVIALLSERIAKAQEKSTHLKRVLYSIRNVNQLITKEKDRDRLLKGACDNLTQTRGYYSAWIVLFDENRDLVTTAESGLGKDFLLMVDRLKGGTLTDCGQKALDQAEVVIIEDPPSACTDCPLSIQYSGRGAMTIRLEHEGKIYGIVSASVPKDFLSDEEEQLLFEEVSADIAFALHNIELEEERKKAGTKLMESEEKYRLLADNVTDTIWVMDLSALRLTYTSPSIKKILGYTDNEVMNRPIQDFLTSQSLKSMMDVLKEEMARERSGKTDPSRSQTLELEQYRKDGSTVWTEVTASFLQDANDKATAVIGVTRDITARKHAEDALKASQDYTRNIIDSSLDMIIAVDMNRCIVEFNKAAERTFGYRREDIAGTMVDILYADPDEGLEVHRTALDKGQCTREILNRHKNGEVFPSFLSASTLLDTHGNVQGVMGVSRDITEQKQAQDKLTASLKEKEVLLKEVHHRVKNNLQVISSLLNLQSRHITDKASRAMFKESQSRIRAMALIHEKLYTSEDLAHIDIAEYMQDLTASLFSTYTVRNAIKVNIAITDIFLTITTAIPCGLIINELVTNALKHAFPHQQDGTITISMTPSTNDSLILTVSDTGIGFPKDIDFRNTTTLGMQLVTSLVEQLEGTITLDRSEGTRFRIEFRKQE